MKAGEILEKLQVWGLAVLVFLLPLFFLSTTPDFFDFNKTALLVAGVLLLSLVYSLSSLARGEIRLRTSPFDLPLLAFTASVVLATAVVSPNKMDAFLSPGLTTVVLAGTLLYFLLLQVAGNAGSYTRALVHSLLASGLVLALVSIAASTGLLEQITQLPDYTKVRTFSLVGAPLPTVTLFLLLLSLAAGAAFAEFKKKKLLVSSVYGLLATVYTLAMAGIVFQILPGKVATPRILPIDNGWAIAVETLKNSPLLGVGPGNFLSAFNQYRPLTYNTTDVWNLRFAASSNWYLHVLTVAGVLGLATFLFLAWRVIRRVRVWGLGVKAKGFPFIHYSLLLVFLIFLLVPANFLLLVTFFLLLGLVAAEHASETRLRLQAIGVKAETLGARALPGLFFVFVLLLTIAVFYLGGRAYAAEVNFRRALEAAARNEGTTTYNLLINSIGLNPRVDRYRITYAQTNLALANAIAQQEELTEADRATITQLVQQAIREGKAAVALNPTRAQNWEALGRIYRALLPFAQGADQWTVATYSQAVALEPVNPNLRISLGGVFYALGRYDDAVRSFELATAAKPDLANAHYNLAAALREKGEFQRAVAEMETTLSLVDPGSADYQVAQNELEGLRKRLAEGIEGSGETLQAPQPAPEPVIRPPLELPEEASPPAAQE